MRKLPTVLRSLFQHDQDALEKISKMEEQVRSQLMRREDQWNRIIDWIRLKNNCYSAIIYVHYLEVHMLGRSDASREKENVSFSSSYWSCNPLTSKESLKFLTKQSSGGSIDDTRGASVDIGQETKYNWQKSFQTESRRWFNHGGTDAYIDVPCCIWHG